MPYEREWRTDERNGHRFLALNSRQKYMNRLWRRREPTTFDEVQTSNAMFVTWSLVRRAHRTGQPIAPEIKEKIITGLRRTMVESHSRKARYYAAAILFCICYGRYDANIKWQPVQLRGSLADHRRGSKKHAGSHPKRPAE